MAGAVPGMLLMLLLLRRAPDIAQPAAVAAAR
jgi:hypothetical protein